MPPSHNVGLSSNLGHLSLITQAPVMITAGEAAHCELLQYCQGTQLRALPHPVEGTKHPVGAGSRQKGVEVVIPYAQGVLQSSVASVAAVGEAHWLVEQKLRCPTGCSHTLLIPALHACLCGLQVTAANNGQACSSCSCKQDRVSQSAWTLLACALLLLFYSVFGTKAAARQQHASKTLMRDMGTYIRTSTRSPYYA